MLPVSNIERARYRMRLREKIDQALDRAAARRLREVEERARKERLALEREKSTLVGAIQLCQRFLKSPMTPTEELYARSLVDLREQEAALEKQATARYLGG